MDNEHSRPPPWICGDNLTAAQERDSRIARALKQRIEGIDGEMHACKEERQAAYELADACLDDLDELANRRFMLTHALWWKVELRLAVAVFRQQEAAA